MLNGYKTYTGLFITLLGVIGLSGIISVEELNRGIELTISLVGIFISAYGRYAARPR